MDILTQTYLENQGLANAIIGLLVFGGMARVAFWREHDGLKVGGPLAVGLGLLLTIAIILWAAEEGRTVSEFGPFAAGLAVMAIIILGWRAFTKSSEL